MVLLTNLFRISVPCGRHNVVPIENPLYFHSFNHFFGWVGSTKMIPFPPTCAQSSVENFSACGELNFSPIVNYSFDWLINSFDYLWQTECCANRKFIVFSKVMIITLDNYQADIIFWVGGRYKNDPFPCKLYTIKCWKCQRLRRAKFFPHKK